MLTDQSCEVPMTDEELLDRFVSCRDAAAFASLVRRHGPMVLGVCRRILHHPQDAEDAFQATFLVLVRKAASLGQRELLGNWLYGVAYRTALDARAAAMRRQKREKQVISMPEPEIRDDSVEWSDLRPLLDRELNRLPVDDSSGQVEFWDAQSWKVKHVLQHDLAGRQNVGQRQSRHDCPPLVHQSINFITSPKRKRQLPHRRLRFRLVPD